MRKEIIVFQHRWFSGRIVASHVIDPGSIPGRLRFYLIEKTTKESYVALFEREHGDSSQDNKQCFSTNKTLCSIYGAQKKTNESGRYRYQASVVQW